jgi:hypothetical protein
MQLSMMKKGTGELLISMLDKWIQTWIKLDMSISWKVVSRA